MKDVEKYIRKLAVQYAEEALLEVMQSNAAVSEVPFDTGLLRSFGSNVRQSVARSVDEVVFGYYAQDPDNGFLYALYQHEADDSAWERKTPGTKSKYLIDPFNNNRERIIEIIAEKLDGAL